MGASRSRSLKPFLAVTDGPMQGTLESLVTGRKSKSGEAKQSLQATQ